MRKYNQDDIKNFSNQYNEFYQYYFVAHSKFRPHAKSQGSIDWNRERLSNKLHKTMKLLTVAIHPEYFKSHFSVKKKQDFLIVTTIEGLSPMDHSKMTTHFNVLIGNLPKGVDKDILRDKFLEIWVKQMKESDDFWITGKEDLKCLNETDEDPLEAVNGYIVKTGRTDKSKAWSTNGFWDVKNTWIPHEALVLK